MANQLVETNLQAVDRFVVRLSRYANSEVIYYSNRNILTFKTYKKTPIPISSEDKYMVINASYEYRPDKVSNLAYGVPDFWWKILEANNLKDVYEFKTGLNIRVPGNIFS